MLIGISFCNPAMLDAQWSQLMPMLFRLFLSVWLVLLTQSLSAHSIFQNPLRIYYTEKEVEARVYVSVKEICAASGIPIDLDGNFERGAVEQAAPAHLAYLLKHFTLLVDGQPWKPELTEVESPKVWDAPVTATDAKDAGTVVEGSKRDRPDRMFFQYHLKAATQVAPATLAVSHTMMADVPYAEGTPFNMSYSFIVAPPDGTTPAIGMLPAGQSYEYATIFNKDEAAAAPQTLGQRFWLFLVNGLEHVLAGYDHMLFAAALVLGLRGFWPVVKVIGLFTIAHSITVSLAAYGLLGFMNGFPKEPVIAGSIVVVALENVFFPKAEFGWRRMGMVFLFGLIHGLGFAEVFHESMMGLSASIIALALVAFCVGVELAHLCIVAPLSALLGWGQQVAGEVFRHRAQVWGSVLVAIGGVYFLAASLEWLPPNLMPDILLGAK